MSKRTLVLLLALVVVLTSVYSRVACSPKEQEHGISHQGVHPGRAGLDQKRVDLSPEQRIPIGVDSVPRDSGSSGPAQTENGSEGAPDYPKSLADLIQAEPVEVFGHLMLETEKGVYESTETGRFSVYASKSLKPPMVGRYGFPIQVERG